MLGAQMGVTVCANQAFMPRISAISFNVLPSCTKVEAVLWRKPCQRNCLIFWSLSNWPIVCDIRKVCSYLLVDRRNRPLPDDRDRALAGKLKTNSGHTSET
jgi:hypothetical protein